MADFVLFDLGEKSLLEPISHDARKFRVTMYNPELLSRTHAQGRHQYLVARDIVDADVVINIPKLKCHKKACVTGALKNMVGINGNKEFLPHHRKGGSEGGGDCYPGASRLKGYAEGLLDVSNRSAHAVVQRTAARLAELAVRAARSMGEDQNLEGSWFGNDTVWRMCLDLQRVVRFGTRDGVLDPKPQRTVLTVTDAIIGGEGEGPLAPTPIESGFMTLGLNPAAVEWVHARLMGFDPERIPVTRNAFVQFPYSLADFSPADIRVRLGEQEFDPASVPSPSPRPFRPSSGWAGHCELNASPRAQPDLVA
jgi:hypothetical protein